MGLPNQKVKDTVEVMLHKTGTESIVTVPEEDLKILASAVAGEMPLTYEDEALKAQAVASFTLIKSNPNFTQEYMSIDEMKTKWGDDFSENYAHVCNVVKSVYGEYMTYDGEILKTVAFHATSPGKTIPANDTWGGDPIPYLMSVSSEKDKLSPDYKKVAKFSEEQVLNALKGKSINSLSFEDKVEIRNSLGLRSPVFDIEYNETDKSYSITTYGYGHGVGMSQFGANELAKEGKTYREILKHYYSGVEIVSEH